MFRQDKFKALVLYFLRLAGGKVKGRTRLAKWVLYADLEAYRSRGKSITGDLYVRETHGPIPAHFYDVLDDLKESGVLQETLEPMDEVMVVVYSLKSPGEITGLTEEEQRIARKVYEESRDHTGARLSRETHTLPAWKYAEPGDPIHIAELAIADEETYQRYQELLEDIEDSDRDVLEILKALQKKPSP